MADNPNVVNKDSDNPNVVNKDTDNLNVENQDTVKHTVPYSVFKDTKEQLKELKTQLAGLQEKANLAKEKKMQEEGQLKELLIEKNSLIEKQNEQLQEWTTYKADKRNALLNQIPEGDRVIYQDLSLNNLEAHVNKLTATKGVNVSSATGNRTKKEQFGGYSSWQEYAIKDPVNAQKELTQIKRGM